jgi:hypothetical protein
MAMAWFKRRVRATVDKLTGGAILSALERARVVVARNIPRRRQLRALADTARFVEREMPAVPSYENKLALLSAAIDAARLPGLYLEFGVFRGTTINHIAEKSGRPVYGFDSFEGLPESWRDGYAKGMFKLDALPEVHPRVVLVKGWFDQTLPAFLADHPEPCAFVHVDCDLYSSTRTVLTLLAKRIVPGSVLVFDEFFNYPGWRHGEYKAFTEFVRDRGAAFEYLGFARCHSQVAVRIIGVKEE